MESSDTPRPRISKSLRYEILRRDNHACRYCGATAPGVQLVVDHVVPVALGGTTTPDNLVAACADCNAGKKATPPGAPLVDDVREDAIRWARAMERAAQAQRMLREELTEFLDWFEAEWARWTYGVMDKPFPLPASWRDTIERFLENQCTGEDLRYAVNTAMRSNADIENKWRYFCGVMWRMIAARQEIARGLIETDGEPWTG